MYEEKVAALLVYWLSEKMGKSVEGVWTQTPPRPLYPYLNLEVEEVKKAPFDHRARIVFYITLVSKYPGQKETLSLLGTLTTLFNASTHQFGVFRLDDQSPTKIDNDQITRRTRLKTSCFLPEDINL